MRRVGAQHQILRLLPVKSPRLYQRSRAVTEHAIRMPRTILTVGVRQPPCLAAVRVTMTPSEGCDPDAAYDPSRTCVRTPLSNPAVGASRSAVYQPATPVARANVPPAPTPPTIAPVIGGVWAIQVGAFSSTMQARLAANGVHDALVDLLSTAQIELLPTSPFGNRTFYRARLSNLSADVANTACARLAVQQQPCIVVAPGQAS